MIHIHRKLDSETLHLPELKPLIGKTVEITIEEKPSVSDEFYAELARLPETLEAYEAQRAIFRKWRSDQRFEVYWALLDQRLARSLEHLQRWAAAIAALPELEGYDFDAYKEQREYDRLHAGDTWCNVAAENQGPLHAFSICQKAPPSPRRSWAPARQTA